MKVVNSFKLILLIITVIFLSGCLPASFFKGLGNIFKPGVSDDADPYQRTTVKIIPLRIPKSGERLAITDPETDEEYTVIIGEVYTSASGKHCSRYTIERENLPSESGLACFEKQEEWIKVPLQLPGNNSSF